MADISKKELRDEITAFLKDANLATTSAKKVRQHLEKKLDCDLSERKKEIDEMVMAWVKENQDDANEDEPEEDEDEEEDEESEEEKKPKKRAAPAKKKKRDSDSESEEDEGSDDDYSPKKKVTKKAKGKKKGSDSDSDEWKEPKKKAAKKGGGGGAKRGGTGFTKVCNLSPALAAVVGSETMARHDVVKKIWAIIKERNLYDPKNKQFAICDDQMQKVFGVKRFRTFGMMKYLKDHFVD